MKSSRTVSRASTRARRSSTTTIPSRCWAATAITRPLRTPQSGAEYARSIRKRSSIRRWVAAGTAFRSSNATRISNRSRKPVLLDLGLVDPGTTNIGRFHADGAPRAESLVYQNTFADAVYMIETCRSRELGMSISIFEPGFVRVIAGYLRAGSYRQVRSSSSTSAARKPASDCRRRKPHWTRTWKCSTRGRCRGSYRFRAAI